MQFYGGDMFRRVRDHADDVFCSLPPMAHIDSTGLNSSSGVPTAPPIDMRRFNNRDNPCFHGDCVVQMADGSFKRVAEVVRGDTVMDVHGNVETVMCVVRTEVDGGFTELVELPSKLVSSDVSLPLLVTPWHPVVVQQSWSFPAIISPDPID